MNRMKWSHAALALGILGMILRWSIFCFFTDERGLLRPSSLEVCLWGLTALAAAGAAALELWKDVPLRSFSRPVAAGGNFLFALGIGITVLSGPLGSIGILNVLAVVLGLAAAAAMVILGYEKLRGKHAPFGCHGTVAVFVVLLMVARYQKLSAHTQPVDFIFPLLGGILLSLCAYWHTAFDCGLGKRKGLALCTLLGIYFCLCAAGHDLPWLYGTAAVWMALNPARANLSGSGT